MGGSGDSSNDKLELWEMNDRMAILLTLEDKPGILNRALNIMTENKINLTAINSRPPKLINKQRTMNFNIDFEGTHDMPNVKTALEELSGLGVATTTVGTPEAPWFPTKIEDFNHIGKRVLAEGDGIQEVDHPSFRDTEYRERRNEILDIAMNYKVGEEIPRLKYNKSENETWAFCYSKLIKMFETNACKEFNQAIKEFQDQVGFSESEIPQLEDISAFLQSKTGWRLKPVGGLLTQREFLNGLAFRIFHSTQYIRHSSKPLYTPEPDIVHELLGHAPMFANKDFAEFSQEIGLASLGASELELKRLAAVYWFTIEFGICKENGQHKAYGAGLMSSVGELAYCVSDEPKFYPLDPYEIGQNHTDDLVVSSIQPHYFVAESF